MGSTLPNREYMHAAQSYGHDRQRPAAADAVPDGLPRHDDLRGAASKAGVSNRYFFNDVPVVGALGRSRASPARARSRSTTQRCATGTLPARLVRRPELRRQRRRGAGPVGRRAPARRRARPARRSWPTSSTRSWSRRSSSAARSSSSTTSGAGSSTTSRPPRVPDDRNSRDINKDYGLMGFRIPALAVSPYVRRGHVAHTIYGFESILKMIEYRFGAEAADQARRATRSNIARSFDWSSKPRLELPDLPRPGARRVAGLPGRPRRRAPRGPTTTT